MYFTISFDQIKDFFYSLLKCKAELRASVVKELEGQTSVTLSMLNASLSRASLLEWSDRVSNIEILE